MRMGRDSPAVLLTYKAVSDHTEETGKRMIELGVLSLLALGGAFGLSVRSSARRRLRHEVEYVVKYFDLAQTGSARNTFLFQGEVEGVHLSIRFRGSTAVVSATGEIPDTLNIGERPQLASFQRLGVDSGDRAFDQTILVEGDTASAVAVLTHETRKQVLDFISGGGTVQAGRVEKTVRGGLRARNDLRHEIEGALRVAQGLSLQEEPWVRLRTNSTTDPITEVRLRNLTTLVRGNPKSEITQKALISALRDADPQIRLFGARFAGSEATSVLCNLTGTGYGITVRCEAIRLLGRLVAEPEARTRLLRLLSDPSLEIAVAAIRALAGSQLEAVIEELIQESQSATGAVATALVDALAEHQHPEIEDALLRFLVSGDSETMASAATVLGIQGSLKSVEPLMKLATGRGVDGEVAIAARDAINRIQARSGGAERGGLAIVSADERGGLALAAEAGALSTTAPVEASVEEPAQREQCSIEIDG